MYRSIAEPLDVARHHRAAFQSGLRTVDDFFAKTANKLTRAANLRTFVLADKDNVVLGFYALNAASIDYRELPAHFKRTRPIHGKIPATFIAMIGVDRKVQGKGLGRDLLVDCLCRIAEAEKSIGIAVTLLDVLDCGNPEQVERRKSFYVRHGFKPLADQPLRMFMPTVTLRELVDP